MKMTRYSPIFNPALQGIFNNYLQICIMNEEQECILRLWHFIPQLSVLMHERQGDNMSAIFMEMVYTIDLHANNNKNNCDMKCFFCS